MLPDVDKLNDEPAAATAFAVFARITVPDVVPLRNILPLPVVVADALAIRFTAPVDPLEITRLFASPVAPIFPVFAVSVIFGLERLPPTARRMLVCAVMVMPLF